jgi:predicted RNA-binding Zn-ribbon protein involved in translation (DUF1610 family)
MASPSQATILTCTQCGGELHPDEGQSFLTCPYCAATVYVDKSQVVFHWALTPTLDAQQALAALHRWMSGSQTVKDLDRKARVVAQTFQRFPLWYFKAADARGELIDLELAAASSVTELRKLALPAGDLKPYNAADVDEALDPSVPLDTARDWLLQAHPESQVREIALVHVPVYFFKYAYRNQTYTALVEAATGQVLANLYPAKAEAPYKVVAGVTAAFYLLLALVAAIAGDGGGGLTLGLVFIVGLAAAPVLVAAAAWVASRV